MKCYVRISHTFRILIHSIGMLVFPLLLAFLARVNDKNIVDLEGITNMLAETPIAEFNDKIYRQISWHSKWSERDLSSCRTAVVARSSVCKDKYWLINLFIKMFSNCRFYRRKSDGESDGLLKQIGLFSFFYGSMKRCNGQKCWSMNQKTVGNNSQYFAECEEREPLNRCITDSEVKEICFTLHR